MKVYPQLVADKAGGERPALERLGRIPMPHGVHHVDMARRGHDGGQPGGASPGMRSKAVTPGGMSAQSGRLQAKIATLGRKGAGSSREPA